MGLVAVPVLFIAIRLSYRIPSTSPLLHPDPRPFREAFAQWATQQRFEAIAPGPMLDATRIALVRPVSDVFDYGFPMWAEKSAQELSLWSSMGINGFHRRSVTVLFGFFMAYYNAPVRFFAMVQFERAVPTGLGRFELWPPYVSTGSSRSEWYGFMYKKVLEPMDSPSGAGVRFRAGRPNAALPYVQEHLLEWYRQLEDRPVIHIGDGRVECAASFKPTPEGAAEVPARLSLLLERAATVDSLLAGDVKG